MATIFEDFDGNSNTNVDMATWYNSFKNPPSDTANLDENKPEEKKPVTKINPILSDLMLYAFQLKAYSEFIVQIANSIEADIQADIRADNTIPVVPVFPNPAIANPEPEIPVVKPLTFAVKNREGLITAGSNINELVKAVDSILSRVKGIS